MHFHHHSKFRPIRKRDGVLFFCLVMLALIVFYGVDLATR